jgi:hypothetical protein
MRDFVIHSVRPEAFRRVGKGILADGVAIEECMMEDIGMLDLGLVSDVEAIRVKQISHLKKADAIGGEILHWSTWSSNQCHAVLMGITLPVFHAFIQTEHHLHAIAIHRNGTIVVHKTGRWVNCTSP